MSTNPFSEENSTHDQFLLQLHVSAMVPLAILEIQQRGGPDDLDYERVRSYVSELGAKGDAILYPSKPKGKSAEMVSKLVEAIAVLAFQPGGFKVFGLFYNVSGIPEDEHSHPNGSAPSLANAMDRLPHLQKTTEEEYIK